MECPRIQNKSPFFPYLEISTPQITSSPKHREPKTSTSNLLPTPIDK
jgi:hypothetical protein